MTFTPVEFFKIQDRIAAFIAVNDPASDREITIRAMEDVLGENDERVRKVRAGQAMHFDVVLPGARS